MDRRWRGQQGQQALSTLQSFFSYKEELPVLAADVGLATPADVYSTHSFLHAKGRRTRVVCNSEGTVLYLVVVPEAEVNLAGFERHDATADWSHLCCCRTARKLPLAALPRMW